MSLTFDFTINDHNQREAQAIISGLKSDVATRQAKKFAQTVDFLLNGNTIPFLEVMGKTTELHALIDSLPNIEKRRLAGALSERFLNHGFHVSRELKTWCLTVAPNQVGRVLSDKNQPRCQ
jgi:hypothetical protein